jgi:hypothetical protein
MWREERSAFWHLGASCVFGGTDINTAQFRRATANSSAKLMWQRSEAYVYQTSTRQPTTHPLHTGWVRAFYLRDDETCIACVEPTT